MRANRRVYLFLYYFFIWIETAFYMKFTRKGFRKLLIMLLINIFIGNVITSVLAGLNYLLDWHVIVHVSVYSMLIGLYIWQGHNLIVEFVAKRYPWLSNLLNAPFTAF